MLKIKMTTNLSNPYDGQVQGGIPPLSQQFLMFYYLPTGMKVGNVTTTGPTYWTAWRSDEGDSAVWGVLNYTVKKGTPYAFKYKSNANGFQFIANGICGYGTNVVTFSADTYDLNNNPLTSSGLTSWKLDETESNSYNGSVFQLEQINTNLPTDSIFSGVWYTMKNNGNVVIPPVFDQVNNNIGIYPFPNASTQNMTFTAGSLLLQPHVMFIPYTNSMSYWISGKCQLGSYNTSMIMNNDWILKKWSDDNAGGYVDQFTQAQCYGYLGKNSNYCAYVGNNCNGGFGYMYCDDSSSCGKCYGLCTGNKKGMSCIWDNQGGPSSSNFYCSNLLGTTNTDPDSSGGLNVGHWILIIIIVIATILVVLMLIAWVIRSGIFTKKY